PHLKPFCEGDCQGPHAGTQNQIVVCFNNEMNMVGLKGKMQNPESLFPGVDNASAKQSQARFVADRTFELEVYMAWGSSSHRLSFQMGHTSGADSFSTGAFSFSSAF